MMKFWPILLLPCVGLALWAQAPEGKDGATAEASRFPEIEFAASDAFRTGSYVQPLWKELHFEGTTLAAKKTTLAVQALAGHSAGRNSWWRQASVSSSGPTSFEACPPSRSGGSTNGAGSSVKA